MSSVRLRVQLGPHGEVPLSAEHRNALGGGVRIAVAGTLNGEPFQTTSFRMGEFTGIALRKEVRDAAGAIPGEDADVEICRAGARLTGHR